MEEKNIIPLKKKRKKPVENRYTNLVCYFNQISSDVNFDYFILFERNHISHVPCYFVNYDGKFYNNHYNFLDLISIFVITCKTGCANTLMFLVSNHEHYELGYRINDNRKPYYLSEDNNVVRSRQLFTLGVMSLIKDYFFACDKNNEKKSNNEQLITNLFEDIFLNNFKLINDFKDISKKTRCSFNIVMKTLDTIFDKYINDVKEINKVKDGILNYYKKFLSNKHIDQKNRVLYFVNQCNNELSEMDMEVNNINKQNQFYQNLNSAFREVSKMNYQVITSNSELDETDMDINNMDEQNQFYQCLNSAFREVSKMNYQVITSFSKYMK